MSKRTGRKQAARVVREQLARERRRRRMIWTSVAAALVLLVAGITGYAVYRAQQPDAGFPVPAGATSDRRGVQLGSGPVTVEIYLDYQCPACRQFETDAGDDIDQYLKSNRITLVYRPVAILDRVSPNEYSSRSAATAGCAADGGKLNEYTAALYAKQPEEGSPGPTDDQLIGVGSSVGLGDAFAQCVRDNRYAPWVQDVTQSMTDRGVTGTPTVFVNGRQLTKPTAQTLRTAVDAG